MNEDILSLYELNALVRRGIEQAMPDACWIQAELSDVRQNANGHCYLEFVQKDERSGQMVAKARGMIWNQVFLMLKPYFEETTGQAFSNGLKVLVQVTVQFHELYGYSLTVTDIDPAYTIGDMAKRRREIILQLEEDGILTMNKELPTPVLPQRIAVISSATAAGYEDFSHQLANNPYGFAFYTELFPAFMQGNQVEQSVLSALDKIHQRMAEFDVVVIIRGGGATSELASFDSYLLAAACAQFDLPVLVGIGHERDETVLDTVAHVSVKTPTAAAEWLIGRIYESAAHLNYLSNRIKEGVLQRVNNESSRLKLWQTRLPSMVVRRLSNEKRTLMMLENRLGQAVKARIMRETHRIDLMKQRIEDASPEKLLARGYSITLKDGKAVKDSRDVKEGDELITYVLTGSFASKVIKNKDK